jgi:hypothetical protein
LVDGCPYEFVILLDKPKQWFCNLGIPRYELFVIPTNPKKTLTLVIDFGIGNFSTTMIFLKSR